jgi:hypothetical protein
MNGARYQLVLQFAADTIADYDALVTMEHQVIDALGDGSVDGHDLGSGEANIFIHTCDPEDTFRQITPLLTRSGRMLGVTAAYRRTDEDEYRILWPKNSSRHFSVV